MKMDGLGVSYESKERNIVLICNENNVNRWSVVLIDKWRGVEGGVVWMGGGAWWNIKEQGCSAQCGLMVGGGGNVE